LSDGGYSDNLCGESTSSSLGPELRKRDLSFQATTGLTFLAYFRAAKVVTAKVQLDVSCHGVLCTIGAQIAQLGVLIFEQSVAGTADAVAKDMMTDFLYDRIHGYLRSAVTAILVPGICFRMVQGA
jgi:hypothetical protein